MAAECMSQLEAAAKVMLAPPSVVTPDQRNAAEQVFLNYRMSKTPYALCRQILEHSSVDYVLFETATTLKDALIREWKELPEPEVNDLRQYLFDYVVQRPNMRLYVRERILQVIAIMIKRQSMVDFGQARGKLLTEVEQIIMEGDLARQVLGCSILSAILQEFSITVKSSDIGLVWEDHFTLKKDFERGSYKKILKLLVTALTEVVKLPLPFSEDAQTLLKSLLSLCETVLCWDFLPNTPKRLYRKVIELFESSDMADRLTSLKLDAQSIEFIIDRNVINLFFDVYWKIRDNPHLSHHALTCLSQLASLKQTTHNKEVSYTYFKNYMELFVKLVSSIDVLDREALGISNIISHLITYCSLKNSFLPNELIRSFLEQLTRLTVYFSEGAAHEEHVQVDDRLYLEAFENLMKVWSVVISDAPMFGEDYCKEATVQIFTSFLRSHLSPPDGVRGTGRELDAEEIDDAEEVDSVKYHFQLQTIGALARFVPSNSISLLTKLVEMRIGTLQSNLERIHQNSFNIADSNILANLFEDIHWLLLIAGHLVALECEGETALIPTEIISFSNEKQVDVESTLQVLTSPINPESVSSNTYEAADPTVRLVATVFQLCQLEKKVVEANLSHLLSPLVSATLMWFLRHWALSYLLTNQSHTCEINDALISAFGMETEGAMWTVNFLLSKVESNIKALSSEPTVVEASVDLLVAIVNIREKAKFIVKSEGFWRIVELYQTLDTRLLPSFAKRGLMKAFTLGGAGIEDPNRREEYWYRVIKPSADKLLSLLGEQGFKSSYQNEGCRTIIVNTLESFIGVALGAEVNTVHSVFALTVPILTECAQLIGLYSNYQLIVELILELYLECTRSFICFLTATESMRFYQCCLNTIQVYAKSNRGKRSVEASAEEDAYNDLMILMQLFYNLQSKDFCNLSPPEAAPDNGPSVTAGEVCLYGLRMLMPLMTVDLMKFPSLCKQYYKMIRLICEISPEKIMALDADLLNSILSTVQLGLHNFGKEVNISCCTCIQALSSHVFNTEQQNQFFALAPCVGFFMELILFRQVDFDVLSYCGTALFALMCCYLDEYKTVVQRWISLQTDPSVAERLAKAFNQLTEDVPLHPRYRSNFQNKFDHFVADVHGFLLVK